MDGALTGRTLVLVVNVDWFFLSHRLPIARAAREAGMRVIVAAADTGEGERIRGEGLEYVPLSISRSGRSPGAELRTLAQLVRLYRRERPDIVHHVTVKPVLYGSVAARLTGGPPVVNAISGLGYVFTGGRRSTLLRSLLSRVYQFALAPEHTRTIFQNPDDLEQFVGARLLAREQAVLIRGSGVDCLAYSPVPEPPGVPLVVLPSRMLHDKGIAVFVRAAELLGGCGTRARFVLVGALDPDNPSSVTRAEMDAWTASGVVEWWGHRADMGEVLRSAAVVVLPSRREGLPKVLLEAGACGRPLVATDVPGCREVVRDGVNGRLVPPDDPVALAGALDSLLGDSSLRREYGAAARRMVEDEFRIELVVDRTLALYGSLVSPSGKRHP